MGKHIPEESRRAAVAWIIQQPVRSEAIKAIAKKWRTDTNLVRIWVRKFAGPGNVPKMESEPLELPESLANPRPEKANPVAVPMSETPDPVKISPSSPAELAAASPESDPLAGAPDAEAAERARRAVGEATINSSGGGSSPASPADAGRPAGLSPVPPAPKTDPEDIALVLDTAQTLKSGLVKLVTDRFRPAPLPAEVDAIKPLSPPLKITLEANADWIAPKIRAVLESGVWALVGAAIIDGIITFVALKGLAEKTVERRKAEEKK